MRKAPDEGIVIGIPMLPLMNKDALKCLSSAVRLNSVVRSGNMLDVKCILLGSKVVVAIPTIFITAMPDRLKTIAVDATANGVTVTVPYTNANLLLSPARSLFYLAKL